MLVVWHFIGGGGIVLFPRFDECIRIINSAIAKPVRITSFRLKKRYPAGVKNLVCKMAPFCYQSYLLTRNEGDFVVCLNAIIASSSTT